MKTFPRFFFFSLFVSSFPCPTSDRHQSFKLRLPSIRRDIRSKSRAIEKLPDPENPPIPEEAVPLSQLGSEEGLSLRGDSRGDGYGGQEDRGGGGGGDGDSPNDRLVDTEDPGEEEGGQRWEDYRDDPDSGTQRCSYSPHYPLAQVSSGTVTVLITP